MSTIMQPMRSTIEGERVLILWDEMAVIVQGVDHDRCSQGSTPKEAVEIFRVMFIGEQNLRAEQPCAPCPETPMRCLLSAIWQGLPEYEAKK